VFGAKCLETLFDLRDEAIVIGTTARKKTCIIVTQRIMSRFCLQLSAIALKEEPAFPV